MKLPKRITAAKKAVEALRPGWFLVWRRRATHNVGQAERTKRYRAKKKV